MPLLEAAFQPIRLGERGCRGGCPRNLYPRQLRRWRTGAEEMAFADYLTLTSMIGVAAAEAMRGDDARIADLSAAAERLGLTSRARENN